MRRDDFIRVRGAVFLIYIADLQCGVIILGRKEV